MTIRGYSAYASSAIFGPVPSHWREVPLRHVLQFSTGWTPPTGDDSAYEGDHPWANISDLGPKHLLDTAKHISSSAVALADAAVSEAGSLLFSFKLSIGQVSFAGIDMYTNEAIATFRRSTAMSLAYCYYALPHFLPLNASENIYGAKLLNQRLIQSAQLLVPPLEEQELIAAFLDRETATIDALIAEQQRLIALLLEQRQAVISNAVTKGLNSSAPMRESGIDWLGRIPAHWTLDRLGLHCEFRAGRPHEPYLADDGEHICVTSRFVSTGGVAERRCTENLEPARLGDSLVVMSDLPKGRALARAYFVADNRSFAVNQRVCALRPTQVHPRYLYFLINRNPELLRHDDGFNQTHLSNDDFLKPRFPIPPREEQDILVQVLDAHCERLNLLALESEKAIALLNERRTALITAAVTGQIDVRGLVETAA